jgi:hypothetical protein
VIGILLYLGIVAAAMLHAWNIKRADRLEFVPGQYLPSHQLGYFVSIERSIWAVLSFAIWFRLLKCVQALGLLDLL